MLLVSNHAATVWHRKTASVRSSVRRMLQTVKRWTAQEAVNPCEQWQFVTAAGCSSGHRLVSLVRIYSWRDGLSQCTDFGRSLPLPNSIPKLRRIHNALAYHSYEGLFCSRSERWPHHGRTFSIYLCPLSFWLTLSRGVYPRLDVVHPGRAWSSSPACTWHCSLHYLFLYWGWLL